MSDYGRFTVKGGDDVETRIAGVVDEVAAVMASGIPDDELRSVVLFGGYGRGEGGVEVTGEGERPHNNLDFLVITRGSGDRKHAALRKRLLHDLEPLSEVHGIGIDVGFMSARCLVRSPCRVMWYDMRHGHKAILGDPDFVGSLERFRLDRILPSDFRSLLVNRGTLLVINDEILARPSPSDTDRRTVIKHAIKAVIGYGDALLFVLGDYHWSYVERQRRMRMSFDLPEDLRDRYEEAMEFRFRPDYSQWVDKDLERWTAGLKDVLRGAHLEAESRRLGCAGLTWEAYPREALAASLTDGLPHPKEAARKVLSLLKSRRFPGKAPLAARLGWRLTTPVNHLAAVFPVVAYHLVDPAMRDLAQRVLGARSNSDADLRRAYLSRWGRLADPNFSLVAKRLGLELDHGEGS